MDQDNLIWKYGDFEGKIDIQDAETAEKYSAAFEKMSLTENNQKTTNSPEYIRAYYKMFVDLFDDIFEEGAGVKILGVKANARIATEAYMDFLGFMKAQTETVMQAKNDILDKYSKNRVQSRADKDKQAI